MKNIFLLIATIIILNADDFRMPKTINPLYQKECGSCHLAFQPSLLNRDSWSKMMDNLQDHFKTDASLEPTDTKLIKDYLVKNSSQNLKNPDNVIAISQMPWFTREHRKISQKTISNEKIKTLSNCVACHARANQGDYDEDHIKIPVQSGLHH